MSSLCQTSYGTASTFSRAATSRTALAACASRLQAATGSSGDQTQAAPSPSPATAQLACAAHSSLRARFDTCTPGIRCRARSSARHRPQSWTVSPDADANHCSCTASRSAQVARRNRVPRPIPEPGSAFRALPHLPHQNTCAIIPLNQADRILHQTGFSQPSWTQPHSPSARDGRPVLVIV
jgi:hypothetical protein